VCYVEAHRHYLALYSKSEYNIFALVAPRSPCCRYTHTVCCWHLSRVTKAFKLMFAYVEVEYTFMVQTANVREASTDNRIHFELKGEKGKCGGDFDIPADQGKWVLFLFEWCLGYIIHCTHTGGHKNWHICVRLILRQILTNFQTYFTVRIRRTLVIVLSLHIRPHVKCVATLPREMSSVLKSTTENDDFCNNTF